jgi:hypothetical protein
MGVNAYQGICGLILHSGFGLGYRIVTTLIKIVGWTNEKSLFLLLPGEFIVYQQQCPIGFGFTINFFQGPVGVFREATAQGEGLCGIA